MLLFKSSSEFEAAMLIMLKEIIDEKYENNDFTEKFGDENAGDALAECIDRGYLTGLSYQKNNNSKTIFHGSNPRITFQGLKFIEK